MVFDDGQHRLRLQQSVRFILTEISCLLFLISGVLSLLVDMFSSAVDKSLISCCWESSMVAIFKIHLIYTVLTIAILVGAVTSKLYSLTIVAILAAA